jgi:hypothetical protein
MPGDQRGPARQRRSGAARDIDNRIALAPVCRRLDDDDREPERSSFGRAAVARNGDRAALQPRRETRRDARQVA